MECLICYKVCFDDYYTSLQDKVIGCKLACQLLELPPRFVKKLQESPICPVCIDRLTELDTEIQALQSRISETKKDLETDLINSQELSEKFRNELPERRNVVAVVKKRRRDAEEEEDEFQEIEKDNNVIPLFKSNQHEQEDMDVEKNNNNSYSKRSVENDYEYDQDQEQEEQEENAVDLQDDDDFEPPYQTQDEIERYDKSDPESDYKYDTDPEDPEDPEDKMPSISPIPYEVIEQEKEPQISVSTRASKRNKSTVANNFITVDLDQEDKDQDYIPSDNDDEENNKNKKVQKRATKLTKKEMYEIRAVKIKESILNSKKRSYNKEEENELEEEQLKEKKILDRTCPICKKIFPWPRVVQQHIKRIHTNERPFKCDLCDTSMISIFELNNHKKLSHDKRSQISCKYCSHKSKNKYAYRIHLKRHGKTLKLTTDLRKDKKKSKLSDKTCQTCRKVFTRPSTLKKHIQRVHLNANEREFMCEVCGKAKASANELKYHIRNSHDKASHIKCELCDHVSKNKSAYNIHLQNKHENSTLESRYLCDICSKPFHNLFLLNAHRTKVHANLKYYCDQCEKSYAGKQALTQHIKYTHENVPKEYKHFCKEPGCTRGFYFKSKLDKHIKLQHNLERRFQCHMCPDKTYTESSGLKRHMMSSHTDIRPFPCPVCNKGFTSNTLVKRHAKLHDEEKDRKVTFHNRKRSNP